MITDEMVERAAWTLEKTVMQSKYGWTDEEFEIWWNKDPHFVLHETSWGDDFGRGTRKNRCLWEARILLEAVKIDDTADLDQRMKDAGMIPVSELIRGTPIDKWRVHTGVQDIESFGKYVAMKHREYAIMFSGYELGDKPKDDEMYEWVLGHYAAFCDIHVNFRAALERMNATGK